MQEFTEPQLVSPPKSGSLASFLIESERAAPDGNAVSIPQADGTWRDLTYSQFADEVRELARGIAASGVAVGDRVGIMSRTRYEWTLIDFALWYAGAVPVPIYETSSAEQVEWILSDSGAVGVFLESDHHQEVFDQVKGALPGVARVWVIDRGDLDKLHESSADVSVADLEARRESVSPSDLATIIYTSGTTGRPKGCMLTHSNLMFEVDAVVSGMPEMFTGGNSTLLFLPIAHVFGRAIEIACIRAQVHLGHTADVKNLLPNLESFQPSFLLSVPRVFETVFNKSQAKAAAGGKENIFNTAADTAIEYSRALDSGGPGLVLRAKHMLFDLLVYKKLRAAMGGRVTHAISGGAALGERLGHFYRGMGITIQEGYGLTETAAASTVNRVEHLKIGTVGRPLPGTSARIADDGEILLKGPQIFAGYWNNETATKEVLEDDGWFHSGDIGTIDDDGFVRITGRKKELIVTAGGKNVAPAVLEDRLRANAIVSQCMVVGDAKPFIACLVTLDRESLPIWLENKGKPADMPIEDAVKDPDVLAEVQSAVDNANKAVSKAESIRKFTILTADWTEEGGQLTPSMKLKRNVVMSECEDDVEALYAR
jgi:long-chain acyl-CoA synthetase